MGTAILSGVPAGDGHPVRIVAALNVSPESFYPGSVRRDAVALVEAARQAVAEGADIIDIGSMSTAPYLRGDVSVDEELRRAAWAFETVAGVVRAPLSVDTRRASVAAAALSAGATIVNDVSGLRADAEMAAVAARASGVILTAAHTGPIEAPPLAFVRQLLSDSLQRAERAGIDLARVVLDPGIGFFTRTGIAPERFSCCVLDGLWELLDLGRPLLVGVSRKSFIGKVTGRTDPADRLSGSLAATAVAVYNGAALVRTHDVAATRDAVRIAEAIRGSYSIPGSE
jgi:dihydropteroate synthase